MKPLFSIVVAILVLAATAHAEATEESKELTKGKEPVAEAEETDPQAREERCTTCATGTNRLTKFQALLASPNAEVHTQESFEECSSEKGCAGIKLKDGKVVQKFGSLDDFNAAASAHGSGSEFQFQASKILEGSLPNGGPYWWMNQNSPFKNTGAAGGGANGHLEKFSKFQSSSFSTSSNGGAGGAGGVDLAANPFLNGDFSKLSGGFTSAGGNFAAGQGFESTSSGSSQGAGFAAGQGNGFAAGQGAGFGNGFAAGQGGAFGNGAAQNSFASNSQSSQTFGQNGFANGAQGTTGQAALGATGLGGGQGQGNFNSYNSASKFASTGFTGSSPAPFASTGANVNLIQNGQKSEYDFEQQQQTQQNIDEIFQSTGNVQAHESTSGDLQQTCAGQGYICVHKAQCNNGVVNTNGGSLLQANTQKQYCNTRTEVCCRLETSSLAGAANSQGTLGIGSATFTGSSNQGTGLFSQTGSGSSQSAFGTTGFGAGAGQNTQNTNAFNSINRETSSTGFGANTNQFNTGASQFGSAFGQSSNTNKFASSAVGNGFGSTLAPPPVRINPNGFNNEVFKSTSSFSETDTFSSGSENANVFRPGAIGTVLKPGIPYLPPDTSTGASNVVSTAFVTTPRPFTTPRPVSPPRPFTTPRPVTYLPPVSSTAAPTYLPPIEPLDGSESRPSYVDGGVILDEFLPGPTRTPAPIVPINREIPSSCAAALKCTPIEFCTAEGVMSNTTVVLTRDQEAYRVPLTDCKDLESGRIGKCCRDPYYTDPWPVNQLGKWVPDTFGGNDGKYIPDSRGSPNIQRPVVTARPPVTGGVILNSFRNTPKPILPRGPNQVTPGPTITPGFVKTQYNQNTVTQNGRGQYEQGGRGQYGNQGQFGQGSSFSQTFGQGQTGQVGVGQTVTQGTGSYGQAGRGQYEVVGQGVQANRGTGFQVSQGTGQVVRQGTGVGLTRGQGFGVSQGGGAIVTQGSGQTVSQGSGQSVTQGFGTGVRQGSGFGVSQSSGFGVQQGGGVGVTQGAGFGVTQGSGQSVQTGQGVGVRQGQGFQVTQGGGQFGQFGAGQGTRVGQGFGVSQGGGAVVSTGQGTAVTQGGGFGVQQGGGFGVRQGQGFGVTQGTGTGFGFGQGQSLLQGQRQALVQGQGEESTQESVHRVFLTKYTGSGQCGLLNPQKPYGNRRDLEVDFAEIPWQAMVLLQTNKSLLCGGVITRPDVVLTTASCVEGLQAKNVLIKGGEWKLGIDEEPLPFQIVQVKTILRHPLYQVGSLKNDVAILVLNEDLRLAKNIWPICLPSSQDKLDAFYNGAGECIVTGWGKNVLQAHLLGSIMHGINVSLINPGECQNKLRQDYPHLLDNYEQDSCVCGQPTNPANNICKVDTGSALACTTGDGSYVLRGIYSWESGCQVGNQLAAFFKFDLEWYEWAIGLIESVRFAKYSTVTVTKNKVISQVTGSTYTSGVKGFGVQGQGQAIKQGFGVQGQTGSGATIKQGFGVQQQTGSGIGVKQGFGVQGQSGSGATIKQGFGIQQQTGSGTGVKQGFGVTGIQGQGAAIKQGFGVTGQSGEFGQISTSKFSGQGSKFSSESGENANVNFGTDLNGPLSKTFSATYTEKKFFQTEPKYVTYTTKPEIVTFTTKPEYYTFTTKPKIVTYTTKPEIVTYTTKPEIVTYTTKPEIFTYTTKPKIVTYTTKPQFISYETAGTINNPKYVSPSLSFSEVVGAHKHTAACKCLDKNAK